METFELKFSNIELFAFAIIALALLLIFRAIRNWVPFIIKNIDRNRAFHRYFTLVEIFIWIIFIIFSIQKLSDSNQVYSFGLFGLLMIAAFGVFWFYLRNYINGAVFKLNNKFNISDTVQIGEYQGKIIGMGGLRLEIESENGEVIFIPYNQLSNTVIVKLHPGEMILSHSFTISTPHNKKAKDITENIRFKVLSLPWSSLKKAPHIKLIHNDRELLIYELIVFTIEKEYFFKIEQEIREEFEINKK